MSVPALDASAELALGQQALAQHTRTVKGKDGPKVIILFKAIGNAPVMLQNEYKIPAARAFAAVATFLRRQLGYNARSPLFMYINQAFAPAPDDRIEDLFRAFATNNRLIVNYSTVVAWG